jgi:hypothetical protein
MNCQSFTISVFCLWKRKKIKRNLNYPAEVRVVDCANTGPEHWYYTILVGNGQFWYYTILVGNGQLETSQKVKERGTQSTGARYTQSTGNAWQCRG